MEGFIALPLSQPYRAIGCGMQEEVGSVSCLQGYHISVCGATGVRSVCRESRFGGAACQHVLSRSVVEDDNFLGTIGPYSPVTASAHLNFFPVLNLLLPTHPSPSGHPLCG